MKIILEFNDEELQRADQSFHGPEYAMAAEDFRNSLRDIIKYGEYSEETTLALENVRREFFECFQGLLND